MIEEVFYKEPAVIQELEIYKANDGVTAEELKKVLKYGQDLAGKDYIKRMKEMGLAGDVSFVAEIEGGVYLISFYLFPENRKPASAELKSIPTLNKYMEKIEPLFEGALPVRLNVANSFWTDASIKEQIGSIDF